MKLEREDVLKLYALLSQYSVRLESCAYVGAEEHSDVDHFKKMCKRMLLEVDSSCDSQIEEVKTLSREFVCLTPLRAKIVSSSAGWLDEKCTIELLDDPFEVRVSLDEDPDNVTYLDGDVRVVRTGKSLTLIEELEHGDEVKHVFHVTKFPQQWRHSFPVNELVQLWEVSSDD